MILVLDSSTTQRSNRIVAKGLFKTKRKGFRVGPLSVDRINRALNTELDVADVWVSKACHAHIADDHPDDYQIIMANIVDILRSPTYAGQDIRQPRNFYLVKKIAQPIHGREYALVAIALEVNAHGTYNVKSAYTIKADDVVSRRLNGRLKILV